MPTSHASAAGWRSRGARRRRRRRCSRNADDTAAATMVSRPRPTPPTPPVYRPPGAYYEERPRRSPWPWILGLLASAIAGATGYLLYDRVQDQLNENRPVTVMDVGQIDADLAKAAARGAGLHGAHRQGVERHGRRRGGDPAGPARRRATAEGLDRDAVRLDGDPEGDRARRPRPHADRGDRGDRALESRSEGVLRLFGPPRADGDGAGPGARRDRAARLDACASTSRRASARHRSRT